jgi:ribosomal protein S18 acetylase RimI-like enzyme
MSALVQLTDRSEIARILRRDAALHVYELGDLDDFFWPQTSWHALAGARDETLCLVYRHPALPTVISLCADAARDAMRAMLVALAPTLPDRFYAHTSPGLRDAVSTHRGYDHGRHLKMALRDRGALDAVDARGVHPLRESDRAEVLEFFRDAYPDNWFDPAMLATGKYVAVRGRDGAIVSVAGVHVYSAAQRVAAVGNVATRADQRGRGLAGRTTAALTRDLLATADCIGLNVAADNAAAIRCYERLGFQTIAAYDETLFARGAGHGSER